MTCKPFFGYWQFSFQGSNLNSEDVPLADFFRQDSEILVNATLINSDSKFQYLATSVWLKKDLASGDPCLTSREM